MKTLKHSLLLFACATVLFISGCTDEDPVPPSIDFKGGSSFVSTDVTLETSTTFKVGITATAGDAKLSKFKVTRCCRNNETTIVVPDSSISGDNFSFEKTYITQDIAMDEKWEFIITDKDGETASVSFTIKTEAPDTTTPLGGAQAFTWERCGSTAATGLDQFGLFWEKNTQPGGSGTPTYALIKKDADKLVILTSNDWTSITTAEALKDIVDNTSGVDQYTNVDVNGSTLNDVIATKKGNEYYLLNVTNVTLVPCTLPTGGNKVTITGEYKN